MFDVGDYTLAPWKVVWRYIANDFICAVTESKDEKVIVPNEKLMLLGFDNYLETYYVCALCNSSPVRYAVNSYIVGTQIAPHVLQNVRIPKFNPQSPLHLHLSELSEKAHKVAKDGDGDELSAIEEEIDDLAARIWGLSKDELKEIKLSLKELQ